MKKHLFFLVLVVFLVKGASGQWINTMWVVPANPTVQDTITLYADVSFPAGSCDQHSKLSMVTGNVIEAYAIHCIGSLLFICSHTDTFKINPLPLGTYTYRMHIDHGGLPSPCTPGIVAGPTDSISFTVSPVTGIVVNFPETGLQVFTSQSSDKLLIRNQLQHPVNLSIFSITGARMIYQKVAAGTDEIDIHKLPQGFYYIRIDANGVKVETKRIAIIR